MTMYFVGIDISKYKHDCCIISAANQKVVSKFTFTSDNLFHYISFARRIQGTEYEL